MEPLCALLPLHPSYDREAVQEENQGCQGNGRGCRQGWKVGPLSRVPHIHSCTAAQAVFSLPGGSAQQGAGQELGLPLLGAAELALTLP